MSRALFAVVLIACAPQTAERDAFVPDDAFVGSDAFAAPIDASGCTLAAPSPLPPIGGDIVMLDADAGFQIPAQDGGNPIGVWRGEHVTIFTNDASATPVSGTAWAVITSSEVQLSIDLSIGTEHARLSLRGSYVLDGATLHVTPRCASPSSASFDLDFTSGDSSGTLLMMLGGETLLLHCARTST